MQKSKRQKVAEVDCQKVNIVTRKGRPTKSPFGSPQVSAAGIVLCCSAITNMLFSMLISFI